MLINTVTRKITRKLFLLQTQISTSSWPFDGYWPQLMEDFNISYKSRSTTVLDYAEYVFMGPDGFKNSNYAEDNQALNEYRTKNFMKVKISLIQFAQLMIF